ncbi:ISKra4 family transposase [Streptomyces violascens]|uniref:ISKra4 family transposase n=1 Tax=Streptomyces violascens TaxID=67381 RepID=UPI0036A4ED85
MTPYEDAAMADPFARAVSCLTSLIAGFSRPDALRLPHDQVEEQAAAGGREMARLLLQGHLDLRAEQEAQALTALDAPGRAQIGAGRRRLETGHRRELATVVGTVTVTRCALRAPGLSNLYPADRLLALPRERHSLGLRRLAVLEAVRGSYDGALDAIGRSCGNVVGKRQLEHLVQTAATDTAAFYSARIPAPAGAATLLVLSVDGKGIVMRPEHLRAETARAAQRARHVFRTRLSKGEKANRKRMATLACVYDTDPAVRRPHDVIAPPGGRTGNRRPRPGPVAVHKWLTGSVEQDPAQVIASAFDQAEARDPEHRRTWIVLVDGARHQLGLLQAEATRRGTKIHIVLDIVHVLEKLWAAARCFYAPADPDAEGWVATHAARLLNGATADTVTALNTEADRHDLAGDQRTGIDTCVRYLDNNADFLHYDQALARGWPIGSGAIEGAARHLVADRLAITGSRWSVPGAEALLQLRAIISNGDFTAYWRHHTREETMRLYPRPDQADYSLAA